MNRLIPALVKRFKFTDVLEIGQVRFVWIDNSGPTVSIFFKANNDQNY